MVGNGFRQGAVRALATSIILLGAVAWGQGSIGTIVFASGEANIEPVDAADAFPSGIGEVFAFIEFENLEATDSVGATWYEGTKSFARQETTLGQLLGATGLIPTGKIYFSVVFDPGADPGVYRLDVSLNGQVVQSREFAIEAGGADGAEVGGAVDPPADQAPAQQPPGEPAAESPARRRAAPGAFDQPGIASNRVVPGETISTLHRYPETLSDPQLVFAYHDVQPGSNWGWRVSREGQLVAEQMELAWKEQGEGLHSQPLGVELREGVYDIDLYLDGDLFGSSSVTVGEPVSDPERLLFADEFDDVHSGWGTTATDTGIIEYRDSHLMFTLGGRNAPAVSVPGGVIGDAIVEVEATTIGGPADNALGIVARYQDNDNYYAFLVSADGYYAILHFVDGQLTWDQQWEFDGLTGVRMGMASNQLRLLAQGRLLRFYVNGALRAVVQDALWQEGQMGLFAGVFDEPGVQVAFDKWRVWSLPNQ